MIGGRCTPREGRSRAVLTDEGFLSFSSHSPTGAVSGPSVGKIEVFFVFVANAEVLLYSPLR